LESRKKEGRVSRKEALDRARRVLEALWKALEIRQGVPLEVADALVPREGGAGKEIIVWFSREGGRRSWGWTGCGDSYAFLLFASPFQRCT
jgi:hypothetical protein